ncbi:MAG: undecaprenyl-diphosphate phosphatase [Clostridia bacterium]
MGLKRESVAKYSFLLSTPVVAAAALVDLKDFVFGPAFFVGVFASFIVGVLVIKFLLNYLQKGSFKVFAVYRVILGLFVIGLCISRL